MEDPKQEKFWPTTTVISHTGVILETRAMLAWDLLKVWGMVSGESTRMDATGRAVLDVMTVEKTIERCFSLADLFLDTALKRGEARPFTDSDAMRAAEMEGEIKSAESAMWVSKTRAKE